MIMKTRKNRQTASSVIDGGRKINDSGVEVIKNTESLDHWDFLEEIEAPMWADLSVCDLADDEIDDPWFNISHQFHQCSSSQLLSAVFHPGKVRGSNSISIQEPPSPKLPPSVSKSRGKSYKIKEREQRSMVSSNKQHPVKTLTRSSSVSIGSRKNGKPTSRTEKVKENEGLKARSSCESGLTDVSRNQCSKSSSSSLARQEQEQESSSKSTITSDCCENQENKCLDFSCQTSSQTNGLLSSLRVSLRRSRATRPAARVIADNGNPSEGCKSSSKSSAGSHLDHGSVGKKFTLGAQNKLRTLNDINIKKVSQPLRNKSGVPNGPNVTKAPASNVRDLSNRQGSNSLASKGTSKGKVQQHTSIGKVLRPHKVNQQYQTTIKESEKVGVGRCPAFPAGTTENVSARKATHLKDKPSDMKRVAQKNGITKPIGLKPKEKANNRRSRDKDPAIPARRVYFR